MSASTSSEPLLQTPAPAAEQAADRRGAATLALTCVPAFMVGLDMLVVTIALATIRTSLHASVQALGWTVNAYVLPFGVLMLFGAMLGDRLGRRRMFQVGLLVFTVASAACAVAPTPGALIAARAVQGVGSAVVLPLSLTLVTSAVAPGQRGKAIGVWSAAIGSSVAFGPVVGGAIVQGLSWHWIFWVNVPIGVATILLVPRLLPESRGAKRGFDVPGLVLVSTGLFAAVWAILKGNDQGWSSPGILATMASAVLLLGLFVAWERRAAEPLLPRRVIAQQNVLIANVATFLTSASLLGAAFLLPQYLQTALRHSALGTGLLLLPWTGIVMLISPRVGMAADRIGNRPLMTVGLLLQAAGFAWIAFVAKPDLGYAPLLTPLLLAGIGISLAFPSAANAAVGGTAPQDAGIASALNSSFRQIGGLFGVAIATAVFEHSGGFATARAFTDGLVPALNAAAVISVLGAAAAVGIRTARIHRIHDNVAVLAAESTAEGR